MDRKGASDREVADRFRVSRSPTTAADCKDSGWKNRNPEFLNPGQCLKFVNTGR